MSESGDAGSVPGQPETPFAEDAMEGFVGPERKRMPVDRSGVTIKFNIAGQEGYIVVNGFPAEGEEPELGELFLHDIGKPGSTLAGFADAFAICFSIALQHGASFEMLARKLAHMKFEPRGKTDDPDVPFAESIPDFIVRKTACHFGGSELQADLERIAAEMQAA